MSAKVLGLVLERFPARDAVELAIAITLADAADHDGTHVFPSVSRVARLARTSERTVQRSYVYFKEIGFLVVVRLGGGRGNPTEYAIRLDWLERQKSVLEKDDPPSPILERVTDQKETPPDPRQNSEERVTKGCHSCDTRPTDPSTCLLTTNTTMPKEWLDAADLEVGACSKKVRNPDALRAKILERYNRDGGPGPGVLKQLAARERAQQKCAPPVAEPPPSSPEMMRRSIAALKSITHPRRNNTVDERLG